MTCTEDRKRVRKFLEDLLEEGEYQEVRRHVEECGSCQEYVRMAGSVSSMLMELGRSDAPEELVQSIQFEFEKRKRESLSDSSAAPDSSHPGTFPTVVSGTLSEPAISAGSTRSLKIAVAVLSVLVALLVWREFSSLSRPVISEPKPGPAVDVIVSQPGSTPSTAEHRGDFSWSHIHVHWDHGQIDVLSDAVRRLALDVRYEARGLIVIHVPSDKDAQWRKLLEELPGVVFSESGGAIADEQADRVYSIEYQES